MKQMALFVSALGAIACGSDAATARDQWRITLTTDAPVPQFGDRVLIEISNASGKLACDDAVGCRRTFAADASAWPISFGVVAPDADEPLRIRARFYRASYVGSQGLPAGSALVERVAKLPAPDGITDLWLHLPAHCFGLPADLESGQSCDVDAPVLVTEPSLPATPETLPAPGSWPAAARVPCQSAPQEDMTCVPGGTFLLGDDAGVELLPGIGPAPERVIGLSPFWLDTDEVTVHAVRLLALQGVLADLPTPRSADPNSVEAACSFPASLDDVKNDALPVSCVTRERAHAICAALAKRLPTEAEWEYAASNLDLETSYPWGDDSNACARAVVGRGRTDIVLHDPAAVGLEDAGCRGSAPGKLLPWGPVAGGSNADVTANGIRNLGGNIREFVADEFAPYSAECWSSPEVPSWDPLCATAPSLPISGPNARGGAWGFIPLFAHSWLRVPGEYAPMLGVRCARSDSP